jgi:hypothetical protein
MLSPELYPYPRPRNAPKEEMIMTILKLIMICLLVTFASVHSVFAVDDKALLKKDGYLGRFSKSNSKKISGKITLEIYKPYVDNFASHGYPDINKTKILTIKYDEVWERKRTDYLSKAEIRKFGKDLDLIVVYFKYNLIQASIVKKKFIGNPLTGQKFPGAEYKIISLETRDEIIKHY